MIRAYDEIYLEDAMTNFAAMVDYGTTLCEGDTEVFYMRFLASDSAHQFEIGNPQYLAGLSGLELADTVIEYRKQPDREIQYFPDESSPAYWAGWALAYFQWFTSLPFAQIQQRGLNISRVMQMYNTYHEADISKFVEAAGNIIAEYDISAPNPLKQQRIASGYTQKELAERSGVSLRMIRAYEQGHQPLSRAEAITIRNLSHVLGCRPEVLIL